MELTEVPLKDFEEDHQLYELLSIKSPRTLTAQLPVARLTDYISDLQLNDEILQLAATTQPSDTLDAMCFLHINVKGNITRQCQRCLKLLTKAINHSVQFQFVRAITSHTFQLPEHDIIIADEYPGIIELFCQELMLYLPDIAVHESKKCFPDKNCSNDASNLTHNYAPEKSLGNIQG